MVTLDVFIDRLKGMQYTAKKMGTEILFKLSNEIVRLNNAELLKGLNTKGQIMQRGYSIGYAKKRKKAGLQTAFVDLYFTGKFQNSSKGVKVVEGLDITSDAKYEKYLRKNYPDIRGLNSQQADEQAEKIADELAVELKKYLVE